MNPGVYISRAAILNDTGVETVVQLMFVYKDDTSTLHNMAPAMALDVAAQPMFFAAEIDPNLVDESI